VRVTMIDGEPWFVARDVGVLFFSVTAIQRSGVGQYLGNLSSAEKKTVSCGQMISMGLVNGPGQVAGRTTLISESGLYKLIMRSDKPEAKAFQDWVGKNPAHIFDAQR
jgi:prophage antirepressor-like protein